MKYSIVDYSTVLENDIKRLEAEFYNSASALTKNYYTGAEIIDFVQYGTSKELNENKSGFPTLRLNEFESLFIKQPDKYCDKIDEDTYKSLSLKKGDVLICRTNGNPKLVGKSAIVLKNYDYAFASYLFRIRSDKKKILPTTLVIYLNSSIGRSEIEKYLMVSNQANFSPAKFREILIPQLTENFQDEIDKLVVLSFAKNENANSLYSQADQILLAELNLAGWKPKHRVSFVKKYSDTGSAGRIDAEYFQPMYEQVVKKLYKYKCGYSFLGDMVNVKDNNFTPKGDVVYKYVELANISTNGNINGFTEEVGKDLPTRARRKVNAGDVIISSIEGSLESIALINGSLNNALCSTGFYVVNSEELNSETLLVFLKTKVGQLQLKKGCSGTILTAISKDELARIVIPKIDEKIQKEIKDKIKEMYQAKALSNELLDIAKRSVEMAIERDERKAQEWVNSELKKLNIR